MGVPGHQLRTVKRMGVEVVFEWKPSGSSASPTDTVIIDALIGYSLRGKLRADVAKLITWMNEQPLPVVSLDVPSGFDFETGTSRAPIVTADATLVSGFFA